MSINPRNVIRYNAGDLSVLEGCLPASDLGYQTFQPLNLITGGAFGIDNDSLINRAGTDWIYTEVGSGAAKAIQAASATLPPYARFTTGATQHNNIQIQSAIPGTFGSSTPAAWAPFIAKAGFNVHFRTRFQLTTTVADAAFMLGLAAVDTTLLASSVYGVTDFIGFYKAGSATVGGILRTSSTGTTLPLNEGANATFTPTINTWYTLDMLIKGRDSVNFWVNGRPTGQATLTNLPANTVALSLSAAISANTAAAATLELQTLTAHQEAY